MAQAKLISPVSRQAYERTKVAAYCRVSSNSADQLNSYAAQIRAYTKLIKSNDAWELIEIFADEGLSGMKAENRVEFQRMIEMCEHKQIDLIITKSVSRFARNVKEALNMSESSSFSASASSLKKKASTPWRWAMRCCSTHFPPSRRRSQRRSHRTSGSPS